MTSFGEIIEPSSRALWDNTESDEEDSSPQLCWTTGVKPPGDIDLLLLFEGSAAVEFAEACFVSGQPVDEIIDAKLKMYLVNNNKMAVCTTVGARAEAGEAGQLLRAWAESARGVVAVQSGGAAPLGCTGPGTRALASARAPRPVRPPLEQPNIYDGLSAGVISLRDHLNLPATLYGIMPGDTVLYGLDSSSSQLFTQLFNDLNISIPKAFKPKCKAASNLYM